MRERTSFFLSADCADIVCKSACRKACDKQRVRRYFDFCYLLRKKNGLIIGQGHH